jgi:hypothetical protein
MQDVEQDPIELQKQRQQQQTTFSVADGSVIYDDVSYSYSNLKSGRHYVSPGGRTISMKDSINEKLENRHKSETERLLDKESALLTKDPGTIITSRVDIIKQSSGIIDGAKLIASKGNVDLVSHSGAPKGRIRHI